MFDPVSTYRVQLHAGFTFSDLQRYLPYLQQLGVKTVYTSPIFKAISGSTHGYDGLHPHKINPEIGTLDELRQLSVELKEKGMLWLQDIVPNHMAFHPGNEWLMDVLEKGQRSVYASVFDIDWNSEDYGQRLMVPFLGAGLNDVVNSGDIKIECQAGGFVINCYGNHYPLNPGSWLTILPEHEAPPAIKVLLQQVQETEQSASVATFDENRNSWQQQFEALQQQEAIKRWIAARLQQVNSDSSLLQKITEEQYYRLCSWQETDQSINYRRFFTVNGLICLNVQEKAVFDTYHQLLKTLLDEGVIQGLRVDHVDGLYNPYGYLQQLRALSGTDTYIIVEKILSADEKLPAEWPVQGTTGYDFLAMVNNLLTNKKAEAAFSEFYARLNDNTEPLIQQVRRKKAFILYGHMGGELQNLYRLFINLELVEAGRIEMLPPGSLKKAIGEFLVFCPVYRYYGQNLPLAKEETIAIQAIFDSVKQNQPELSGAISLLEYVWIHKAAEGNDGYNERAAKFYKRCMQFSGPLMAKGVEDTLMYTFNRFIAHNEVGDAADAFGSSGDVFHQEMKDRQKHWPLSLNATSTHDTKRGEDVRARLNVLSDLSHDWFEHVNKWQQLNRQIKRSGAPDANDEYFIYQTLAGTYPMPGNDESNYEERLGEYLQKALREAKLHSNWAEPDEAYEDATRQFVHALLDNKKPFWKSFERLHQKVADYGIVNSLVQVILKFTCPGVPDTYQGSEWWDLSFVDPDNRRPVPLKKYEDILASVLLKERSVPFIKELWRNRFDGRIKLWLVHSLLALRKKHKELFHKGEYIPLSVQGKYKENVLAFARKNGREWLVIVVPLQVAAMCSEQGCRLKNLHWKDTRIVLPRTIKRSWKNVLSSATGRARQDIPAQELFHDLPFAVLEMQGKDNVRGAGILLPVTSLPSAFGIGDLGPQAYRFADLLHGSNQKYWQMLPINPVEAGQGYSPYSAVSSRAGNTWIISPELLVKEGLLPESVLTQYHLPATGIADYEGAKKIRDELLEQAWNRFNNEKGSFLQHEFNDFCDREKDWLHDFALYIVIKEANNGKPWYGWKEEYKQHVGEALDMFAADHQSKLENIKWLQFIFNRQWQQLKTYCNKQHIRLIGDLPFYVSYDSADVWAQKEIFSLGAEGARVGMAGVPPDAFSDDGQLWGMPVFNWKVLKESGYTWWVERLRKNKEMFDLIRLDHFRAFSTYWEVPAGEETARNGQWKTGPGPHFFKTIGKQLGALPFLAEDLGEIDEPVYELRDRFNFPGMKVLQFAFGDDFPVSEHLPQNYNPNFFVYTGTHDNNTVKGWFRKDASIETRMHLSLYSGQEVNEENVNMLMVRMAYASIANVVILPLQDLLALDENARLNTPSSGSNNWLWRLLPQQITEGALAQLCEWVHIYNRGQ